VKKVTNVFTKKVCLGYTYSSSILTIMSLDSHKAMSARAAVVASLPWTQECEFHRFKGMGLS